MKTPKASEPVKYTKAQQAKLANAIYNMADLLNDVFYFPTFIWYKESEKLLGLANEAEFEEDFDDPVANQRKVVRRGAAFFKKQNLRVFSKDVVKRIMKVIDTDKVLP